MCLSDKVILISGASSGIGEESARLLAKQGAKVFLGARRVDRLNEIVSSIKEDGYQAECFLLDVTDMKSVELFMQKAIQTYGRIDVLINNAGVMLLSNVRELKIEQWNQMIDVNLKGMLNCTACYLKLKKQKEGHIINIDSTAGYRVMKKSSVYSVTKFAMRAFSDGLRKEESSNGLKVTLIAPGPTKTELISHISDSEVNSSLQSFVDSSGLNAKDVANTILFAINMPKDASIDELIISPSNKLE